MPPRQKAQPEKQRKIISYNPLPIYQSPISSALLEHLDNRISAQYAMAVKDVVPEEIIAEVEEDWWLIVDKAMNIFDKKLACVFCMKRHECKKTKDVGGLIEELKVEMVGTDVEMIDEAVIKEWQEEFDKIETLYLDKVKDTLCDIYGKESWAKVTDVVKAEDTAEIPK